MREPTDTHSTMVLTITLMIKPLMRKAKKANAYAGKIQKKMH